MVLIGASVRLPWTTWILCLILTGCGYPEPAPLGDAQASSDAQAEGPDAAPPAIGPSCDGLAPTCGPGANAGCCASRLVPGGTYYRSYDAASDGAHDDMSYPATVSDFWLDTYEVTVGRFRAFVEGGMGTQANPPAAGAGAHASILGSGWDPSWNQNLVVDTPALVAAVKCEATTQTWTDSPGANENKPLNCITWFDAFAFCIWDGGYLPTEAEWNYAATGGAEQRAYPWSEPASSTTIDCTYATYMLDLPPGTFCVNGTNPVGSESPTGNGRWGHADLAGNLQEWVVDWYESPYPTISCNDCANLTIRANRVLRGGTFLDVADDLRVAFRDFRSPTVRSRAFGIRCARTL